MLHRLDLSRSSYNKPQAKRRHRSCWCYDYCLFCSKETSKPQEKENSLTSKTLETVLNRDKMPNSGAFSLGVIFEAKQHKMASGAALLENPCRMIFKHFSSLILFHKWLLWTNDQIFAEATTLTHSRHKRQTSVPSGGLEPAIPAIELLQT